MNVDTRPASIGRLTLLAASLLLFGACAGEQPKADSGGGQENNREQVSSELVIDGEKQGEDGRSEGEDASTPGDGAGAERPRRDLSGAQAAQLTVAPPPLLADGTIDDGADPFADTSGTGITTPVMAAPVEDDPQLTEALDTWQQTQVPLLERIDPVTYRAWLAAGMYTLTSTRDDSTSPTSPHVVRVLSKRCGGARTVTSGVVVDDEIVVTTVTAIESVERRVRVQMATASANGIYDARTYPAMLQYVNIDDDVAVLRVPGLGAPPIRRVTAVPGPVPSWAYVVGVADGGRGLRRSHAVLGGPPFLASREQHDGFGEAIDGRRIAPLIGTVSSGSAGAPVVIDVDGDETAGPWLLAGIVRARVPWRSQTAAIVVPADIIDDALDARDANPEWAELQPDRLCSQWTR